MPRPEYDDSGKIVYRFPGGWTIRQIISPHDAKVEGHWMNLSWITQTGCMSVELVEDLIETIERAHFGGATFFSLRDPNNWPCVTIEIEPGGSVGQIHTVHNDKLEGHYKDKVYEWLESVGAMR